jgi:hypothetical protein
MGTRKDDIDCVSLPSIILPKEPVSIQYALWSYENRRLIVAEIAYRASVLTIQEDLVVFPNRDGDPDWIRDVLVHTFNMHAYATKGSRLITIEGVGKALFHANYTGKVDRDAIDRLAGQFIELTEP